MVLWQLVHETLEIRFGFPVWGAWQSTHASLLALPACATLMPE